MEKLLDRTKQLVFSKQTNMLASTILISAMVVVARIFGFMRYRILVQYFTKNELDIFFAAFRIPDLIFEILITGALTTSFIPFFVKYDKNKEQQSVVISSIINILFYVLIGLVVLLSIALPFLVELITPGFPPEKTETVIYYSRILLIGQLPFLVLGNILTGLSQARKMFLIPALAPIVYNIFIIVATLLFAPSWHLFAPVFGVTLGAMGFLLIQLPVVRITQFGYRFGIQSSKAIWQFFRVAVPRIFTVIVAQIDATIDLTLTTLLGPGSYTIFYLAQHLQLLPISVIGVAYGQASLPYLSELAREENSEQFKKIIVDSILNLLFLTVPIASFFIFARTPLVRIFFGAQKFDWEATNQTAFTVSMFAISMPFHVIYYFLTRCFYALFDSRTPFYISFSAVLLNAVLSVWFIMILQMPVWSLGISFSVSMSLNVLLLMYMLYKKIGGYDIRLIFHETAKIAAAAFVAAFASDKLKSLFDQLIFDTTRTINVFFLLVTVFSFFTVVYLFIAWLMSVRELYLITKMMLKARQLQKKAVELYTGTSNFS